MKHDKPQRIAVPDAESSVHNLAYLGLFHSLMQTASYLQRLAGSAHTLTLDQIVGVHQALHLMDMKISRHIPVDSEFQRVCKPEMSLSN